MVFRLSIAASCASEKREISPGCGCATKSLARTCMAVSDSLNARLASAKRDDCWTLPNAVSTVRSLDRYAEAIAAKPTTGISDSTIRRVRTDRSVLKRDRSIGHSGSHERDAEIRDLCKPGMVKKPVGFC